MPDGHTPEDDASRYVLGELNAAERRDFEARLAQSPQLRALIRELEEGTVALSMASPVRRPPPEMWTRIEKAVTAQSRRKIVIPAFWVGWWRNGWAAAAACLVGWFVYALWIQRTGPTEIWPATASSETYSPQANTLVDSLQMETRSTTRSTGPASSSVTTNATYQLLEARTRENETLRRQVAALNNQVTHLSQTLSQQQALLTESNRLKFFQLTSASVGSPTTNAAALSPALRRALLMAVSRQLGWAQFSHSTQGPEPDSDGAHWGATNQWNIDFVDLRPNANGTATPQAQPKVQTQVADGATPSSPPTAPGGAVAPGGAIPAFVSGNDLVVALDSSIVPSGSPLTFSSATDLQGQQTLGNVILGDNPLVVTLANFSANGGVLTITAGTPAGQSNIFQVQIPGTAFP